MGNNGKILNAKIDENILPVVSGSMDIENIYNVVNLLKKSNLDYTAIKKIIFFKSGRFDINLRNDVIIKFPIIFDKKIIDYSNILLNDKKFVNTKIIDLRIKNKIIKNEQLWKGNFYFGISDKKIYICFFEKVKAIIKKNKFWNSW